MLNKRKTKKDPIVRIDPNKHAEKIKELEQIHMAEDSNEGYDYSDEQEEFEPESDDEGDIEDGMSLFEPPMEAGRIDLCFPETVNEFEDSPLCYPPSYYTLSAKERLLLLYCENFRKQFVILNQARRPLVLALPNECNVQKFVCTTIRPTAFVHIPLFGSISEIASFVADFIIYEPLEDMMKLPTRLISPSTLLRRRRGNCFEMATLLCSMLIGAGYPAMVVSGVARPEVLLNDQRNVPYPFDIPEMKPEVKEDKSLKLGQKYKLKSLLDLESHLEENIAEIVRKKDDEERRKEEENLRQQKENFELHTLDRYRYRRTHAWVAIIENAPWSIQPRQTWTNADGETIENPPSARFIEPSTGFECDTKCKQYVLIDSVWNNYNYYVNKQTYQGINEIRWDLTNTDDWEHLLPGEPPEMRTYKVTSEENIAESHRNVFEEKHLDTIQSWVSKLHIGLKEFEERFPKLEKTVRYHRAIHQRFSPYSQRDGKVMQLTLFTDDEYQRPTTRYEIFNNRADKLEKIKYSYDTQLTEETFGKGRNDSLKYMEHSVESKTKRLFFYSAPRLDALTCLEIFKDRIVLHYDERNDRCSYQEFVYKSIGFALKEIIEKFHRNDTIPADNDIAVRTFQIAQGKILLQFHYAKGALTASTREFIKPPRPNYGEELKFETSCTKAYKANIGDPDLTQLEIYKLLLSQLEYEDKIKKKSEIILQEIQTILEQRSTEMQAPVLKFRIFDSLRNGAARNIRLQQFKEKEALAAVMATRPPDFLAPYLCAYKNQQLSYEDSQAIYNACLSDLKSRFIGLLNDLQRQYEDLSAEANSLNRFLNKFEDQFNNNDYQRLVEEARNIELNKRMVQQRLIITHEESQKKYEIVKQFLKSDPRLNL